MPAVQQHPFAAWLRLTASRQWMTRQELRLPSRSPRHR